MEGEDIWHVFNPRMLASKRITEGREQCKVVQERPQNYQYIALCVLEVGEDVGVGVYLCMCESALLN